MSSYRKIYVEQLLNVITNFTKLLIVYSFGSPLDCAAVFQSSSKTQTKPIVLIGWKLKYLILRCINYFKSLQAISTVLWVFVSWNLEWQRRIRIDSPYEWAVVLVIALMVDGGRQMVLSESMLLIERDQHIMYSCGRVQV